MQKLLLNYRDLKQAELLKSFLESRLPYEILLSSDPRETEVTITSKAIHLVLYETKSFSSTDFQFTKEIRSLGYSYPILVLSESIGFEEFFQVADKNKVHFLEKPFEPKALSGIVRKLMTTRQIPQQMFRRFKTNQTSMVETYLSGEALNGQMFNLSVGGAYFEFPKKPNLVTGDLVRLKVNLEDISREYAVHARVIWTTHKGAYSGGPGCGMKFVKGQEIYKQLMEKV